MERLRQRERDIVVHILGREQFAHSYPTVQTHVNGWISLNFGCLLKNSVMMNITVVAACAGGAVWCKKRRLIQGRAQMSF